MLNPKVTRFKKRFPEWVFADTSACLRKRAAVGSVILTCCAIDYLGRFYSGDPGYVGNKTKYVAFLDRYFAPKYDPKDFYKLVRCGLLHGYDMQGRYIVVGSDAAWARSLHLRYDPKHKATLVNPFALYEDLRAAFSEFINDLECDPDLLRRFLNVWASSPFGRPQLSSDWNKFKHLV